MKKEENKKPSNPDAFPFIGANGVHYSGMTLRDYFAAKAMESMLNAMYIKGELSTPEEMIERMKLIPVNSYWFADEMLKQREL